MSRKPKKRSAALPAVLGLVLLAAALFSVRLLLRPAADAGEALEKLVSGCAYAPRGELEGIDARIAEAEAECFSLRSNGITEQRFRSAAGSVSCTFLDPELLTAGLSDEMQVLFEEAASQAKRRSELYDENGTVLPELAERLYIQAMEARLLHPEKYCSSVTKPVSVHYREGRWQLDDEAVLLNLAAGHASSMPGYEEAVSALRPVDFHYALTDLLGPGPVADSSCYGETTDPQVVAALLESAAAKRLINGQALDFDPSRDMLGRSIYYYLDETILAMVWQQDEHGAVGTFAEVLIGDASQFRRKLADDTFGSYNYYYPTEFAAQTNAVVACSGDFYNSGRAAFGLYVYDGKLMRSGLHSGQSCLITDEGDMLFTYENQFASDEEAQRYIDENHVRFSLNFGPVIMDHGVDVTPYDYPFGEVLDTYARCAVGQLGKLHYLAMTINCESPDHYVYVTLRQAADSIIAHGCYNAYTLDGGQTGSILIGGRLINPVQFGVERPMSDIYYFATAIPDD